MDCVLCGARMSCAESRRAAAPAVPPAEGVGPLVRTRRYLCPACDTFHFTEERLVMTRGRAGRGKASRAERGRGKKGCRESYFVLSGNKKESER
jgi:hypothetical protein